MDLIVSLISTIQNMLYAKLGFFGLDGLAPNNLLMILNGKQIKNTTKVKAELMVKPINLNGRLINHTRGHRMSTTKAKGQHKTNNTVQSNKAINTFIIDTFSIISDPLIRELSVAKTQLIVLIINVDTRSIHT